MALPQATTVPEHGRTLEGNWYLEDVFFLPYPRVQIFEFFQEARNLEFLTPPFLQFRVLTPEPVDMGDGTQIDYALKLHGIPLRWRSKISDWDPPARFVDQQLRGPYRLWHHDHHLFEVAGGTLCSDRVTYQVFGGRLVRSLFVVRDLDRIFRYRRLKMNERFPGPPEVAASPGSSDRRDVFSGRDGLKSGEGHEL